MLHYELQPQSQLLYLVITLADVPQSSAFSFLDQLRNAFCRQFRTELAVGMYDALTPAAARLVRNLCDGAHGPDTAAPALSPSNTLPVRVASRVEAARALRLHDDAATSAAIVPATPVPLPLRGPGSTAVDDVHDSGSSGSGDGCTTAGDVNAAVSEAADDDEVGSDKMVLTHAEVSAHIASQLSAIVAIAPHLTISHAVLVLRHFGWSYGGVMDALDATPHLLSDLFPSSVPHTMPPTHASSADSTHDAALAVNVTGYEHGANMPSDAPDPSSVAATITDAAAATPIAAGRAKPGGEEAAASGAATDASLSVVGGASAQFNRERGRDDGGEGVAGGHKATASTAEEGTDADRGPPAADGWEGWSEERRRAYLRAQVFAEPPSPRPCAWHA